jgi:hypothetical protein
MFLHELSRDVSKNWSIKVESEAYADSVRLAFKNCCPYCNVDLLTVTPVVEHLDGMNRHRVGLHVAGNVLVSCRRCNNEKRRDDSLAKLVLASSGWESFLSHDGRCGANCKSCEYWQVIWPEENVRIAALSESMRRILEFRTQFPQFNTLRHTISLALPSLVGKLYADCQNFAENEIESLLRLFRVRIANSEDFNER